MVTGVTVADVVATGTVDSGQSRAALQARPVVLTVLAVLVTDDETTALAAETLRGPGPDSRTRKSAAKGGVARWDAAHYILCRLIFPLVVLLSAMKTA